MACREAAPTMHLSGIYLYPVKSLRGFSVPSAEVDALGLVGDRRFLVVDEAGKFLTQRTLPRMALVATAIGLFAAIPAVVAYNRYSHDIDRLAIRFESFMEEFSNILQRQASR